MNGLNYIASFVFDKINNNFKDNNFAIAVYGSRSRDDYDLWSDYDIFIIFEKNVDLKIFTDFCYSLPDYISAVYYLPNNIDYLKNDLSFWFQVFDLKFLIGEKDLFLRFQSVAHMVFKSLCIDELNNMYNTDNERPKAYYKKTNFEYYNLKRGYGSLVDYKFSTILVIWMNLNQISFSMIEKSLVLLISGIFKILTRYKLFLRKLNCSNIENSYDYENVFYRSNFYKDIRVFIYSPFFLNLLRISLVYYTKQFYLTLKKRINRDGNII